jgi:hypothetical protein
MRKICATLFISLDGVVDRRRPGGRHPTKERR